MLIQVLINGLEVYSEEIAEEISKSETPDFISEMEQYEGTQEYNGIVGEIQKWYYGSLIQAPWCATTVSYFANKLGVLDKIGGKNENVYLMMTACKNSGYGTFYDKDHIPTQLQPNDICFFLFNESGKMNISSNKHVNICVQDRGNNISCIGGNQNDRLMTKDYRRSDLYAVYRL